MAPHVDPDPAQLGRLAATPWEGVLQMLNLIRFHAQARAPDGERLSGAALYARYGAAVEPHLESRGARLLWAARPVPPLIGPQAEEWDMAFVVEYPSLAAFLDMLKDPEYRKITVLRSAAVADSRLIPMHPAARDGWADAEAGGGRVE